MLRIAVHGAAGRMGRRVVALATEDPAVRLLAAVERDGHPALGQDAGVLAGVGDLGVCLADTWPSEIDAVIDFSLPDAVDLVVGKAVQTKTALVMATTGLTAAHHAALRAASEKIAIVWAPSMSLAVNLSMRLAQQAAKSLRDVHGGVDIEVIERHHRFKEDAPSGTALRFGELLAETIRETTGTTTVQHVHGRQGNTGARQSHQIGYHAIRSGDNPGEHTIVFGMLGETIELKVAASNRDCYASGAVTAAKWLAGKSHGLYSMFDVLGL